MLKKSFVTIAAVLMLAACSGEPAPAPPPPPSAPPPVSFMTFFDWGSAKLSEQSVATIAQAAQAYKSKGTARVAVTGYADTTGSDAFNMQLALQRANVVKGELVRDGVPDAAVSTTSRGETGLLVETGKDVKEPRNRRVEILIGQ